MKPKRLLFEKIKRKKSIHKARKPTNRRQKETDSSDSDSGYERDFCDGVAAELLEKICRAVRVKGMKRQMIEHQPLSEITGKTDSIYKNDVKGPALLINNIRFAGKEYRHGANLDMLVELLEQLGYYPVHMFED
ncbi:hypothetical protein niasHT_005967 [Heterodera trifolii]|uniref:Caspase family p20 domain-containing protein n=1 Tax=Heterodera trifolii TaxID=157864 RepID=A0ABD2LZN7_9BILA